MFEGVILGLQKQKMAGESFSKWGVGALIGYAGFYFHSIFVFNSGELSRFVSKWLLWAQFFCFFRVITIVLIKSKLLLNVQSNT